jgi:nicotinate-nucleotide pyrophosphorylase (carboxylating)
MRMSPEPAPPPTEVVRDIVRRALAEDMPWGDATSDALVPPAARAIGRFISRVPGVVSGLPVAESVFRELDGSISWVPCLAEGDTMSSGTVIAEVRGPAHALLAGERTALNFVQRMSGIATATRAYVDGVAGTEASIIDTRKTVPGLRALDKYAVRCGGGTNHRFSLSDAVLVKDNHLAALAGTSLSDALRAARRVLPHTMKIEVEVDRIDQIEDALQGGADIILLDNMSPDLMRQAVALIAGRARTEASGGITLETVRAAAEAGVDLISIGALTHSVLALDISLDLEIVP